MMKMKNAADGLWRSLGDMPKSTASVMRVAGSFLFCCEFCNLTRVRQTGGKWGNTDRAEVEQGSSRTGRCDPFKPKQVLDENERK